MNTKFEELIAKHLNGTIQEDEKRQLAMLLKVPEHQLYLASKIDEQFVDENLKVAGDDEIGASMFRGIQERIRQDQQAKASIAEDQSEVEVVPISWYKSNTIRWIAAASIILVISFLVMRNYQQSNEPSIAVRSNQSADSLKLVVHHEINTTGKDRSIQLPDGSLIVLADKSELTYLIPFGDKRAITLTGKAHFKVAKDKTRPFTVTSGAISTTALGTEFMVTAFAQTRQITVRLYEGKVVVKPSERADWRMKNDVYLSPGQELVYRNDAVAFVRTFAKSKADSKELNSDKITPDNPSLPENADGNWFMFNNQSLEQVLDQMAGFYNVKIIYNKKDVQNINWTGQYNKSDSLETILKRIGIVHNLTITKKDTAFIISK